jgi:hypothetical protein
LYGVLEILRNAIFLLALIWVASPAAGLRPTRAGRLFTSMTPSSSTNPISICVDITSETYNPTLPAGLAWLSLERRT